ncbi:MAG: DUF3575 domain-containing protein [Bacteroidota bacterium]
MKKITAVFLVSLALFMCKPLMSQDHNVKLDLFNLSMGEIRLNYEYIIDDNQSVMLKAGGMIPHGIPSYIYDPSRVEQEYGGESDIKSNISAFNIGLEYRYYPSSPAPNGFYLAPYFRYSRYNFSTSVLYEDELTESDYQDMEPDAQDHAEYNQTTGLYDFDGHGVFSGKFTRIGGGLALGYQWIFDNNISLDWTIIGLGVERWTIGIEAKNETEGYDPDLQEWAEDIENESEDFFLLGNKLDIVTNPDHVKVELPLTMPSIYGGISIGYAF